MYKKFVYIIFVLLVIVPSLCFARDIPFTQDDRDRLIRLETKVEEGLKAVNQRIDGLDKRIDGLQSLIYVLIAAIFTQTIGIVGFVIWDRRTALAPAIKKNKELEEREEKIEKAFRELAKRDKKAHDALKIAGLL